MCILPIITFLQDIFSVVKGPYHRKVGRFTQKFCSRAAKEAKNEVQKKLFFVTAICADEFIAALIGVDNKRSVAYFKEWVLQEKLGKGQMVGVLRVYMSALFTLLSSHKERLLRQTDMEEQELLQTWCRVFEYGPVDVQLFNEVFLPAYGQGSIEALSMVVGKNIMERLFVGNGVLSPLQLKTLQKILIEDTVALLGVLKIEEVEAS